MDVMAGGAVQKEEAGSLGLQIINKHFFDSKDKLEEKKNEINLFPHGKLMTLWGTPSKQFP